MSLVSTIDCEVETILDVSAVLRCVNNFGKAIILVNVNVVGDSTAPLAVVFKDFASHHSLDIFLNQSFFLPSMAGLLA